MTDNNYSEIHEKLVFIVQFKYINKLFLLISLRVLGTFIHCKAVLNNWSLDTYSRIQTSGNRGTRKKISKHNGTKEK